MSSHTVLAFLPLLLLVVALDLYALLDIARASTVRYLPKVAWAALVLVSFPFGALAYLAFGRSPHGHNSHPSSHTEIEATGTRGR